MENEIEELEKVLEPLTKADLTRIIIELVKHPHAIETLLYNSRKIAKSLSSPKQKSQVAVVSKKKISESKLKEAHAMVKKVRIYPHVITQYNILLNTLNLRIGKKSVTGGYGELYTVDTFKRQVSPSGVGKLHSTSRGSRLLNGAAFGTTVVVDRLVYVLGCDPPADCFDESDDEEYEPGEDNAHFHNRASCFDLDRPNDGWRKAPMPQSFDPKPRCASLKGNIYSFRGTWTAGTTDPFLEVLDITSATNRWEAIPPPPQLLATYKILTVSTPVISDLFNKRILVHIKENSSLYAYYPDENKWRCLVVEKFKLWNNTVALYDDVIYFHGHALCCSSEPFQAYHLEAQKWLKVVMSSEFEVHHSYIITDQYQALIDLGYGELCLATFSSDFFSSDFTSSGKTPLIFPKFSVKHSTTEAIVTPISVEQMTIQTECSVVEFLPIAIRMDVDEWYKQVEAKNCKVG